MASSLEGKAPLAGRLVFLGIGLDRLFNAYLVGAKAPDFSIRFVIGEVSTQDWAVCSGGLIACLRGGSYHHDRFSLAIQGRTPAEKLLW